MFLEFTSKKKIFLIVLIIFILLALTILYFVNNYNSRTYNIELFNAISNSSAASIASNGNLFNNPIYEKDRTRLYGSLFLNNLEEQIKNMTDPRIQYNDKRIDIIKYSDVLL